MAADLRKMAELFLVKHGYVGLCNPTAQCGCDLADLMACGEPGTGCVAAYRFDCARCMDGPDHNNDCPLNCMGYDYMMAVEADYCHPVYVGGCCSTATRGCCSTATRPKEDGCRA